MEYQNVIMILIVKQNKLYANIFKILNKKIKFLSFSFWLILLNTLDIISRSAITPQDIFLVFFSSHKKLVDKWLVDEGNNLYT